MTIFGLKFGDFLICYIGNALSVKKHAWRIFVTQKLSWVNSRASRTSLDHKKRMDFFSETIPVPELLVLLGIGIVD